MNAFDDPYNSHSFVKMKMNSDSLFFQNYENNIYVEDQSELELLGLDNNMAQEDLLDLFNPLSHIKTAQALNAENDKLKKQVQFYQQKLEESYENNHQHINPHIIEEPIIPLGHNYDENSMIILDDVENPFPRFTVTESTVRPYPVIVINYQGEANNLLVKAEPAPGCKCVLENHISHFKSKDQNYLQKYIGKIIVFEVLQILDAGKADGDPIQLDFSLYSIDGVNPTLLCTKRSPVIKVFNHSQYLPAPDILKLVPEYCMVNEKTKVDAFGPLFLRKNNILECQISNEDGKEFMLLKEKDIIRKRNCFHNFTYTTPNHEEGAVNVRARYKNRDFGSGKLFFYISKPSLKESEDGIQERIKDMTGNMDTNITENYSHEAKEQFENTNYYSFEGNFDDLRFVLMMNSNNYNLNKVDKYGMTCLHWAVLGGNAKCVRLLLEKGADPNIVSQFSEAPLHIACRLGSSEIATLLIEYNANINIKTSKKISPLHYASLSGNCSIIQTILDADEYDQGVVEHDRDILTPLHYAVFKGQHKVVNLFLNYSESIGEDLFIGDANNMTPLHWAVALGEIECVREFLSVCDERQINLKDTSGRTALFYSVLCPNIEICRELLLHKADPNAQDNIKETPLFSAVSLNENTIVSLLLENGADPNILNIHNEKPFKISEHKSTQLQTTESTTPTTESTIPTTESTTPTTESTTPVYLQTPTPFDESGYDFEALLKDPNFKGDFLSKITHNMKSVEQENEQLKSTVTSLLAKIKMLEEQLENSNLHSVE